MSHNKDLSSSTSAREREKTDDMKHLKSIFALNALLTLK
jgi:hypothetical protein